MKVISYSDLHLEFGTDFKPPEDTDADLMILAGDVCVLKNLEPLHHFLQNWDKPVLYVTGNHEYYTQRSMLTDEEEFKEWLSSHHSHVTLLLNDEISIDGFHFFGGTMWTNFLESHPEAMEFARQSMNDFRLIRTADNAVLDPRDTVVFHETFVKRLIEWFEKPLEGKRVVITHHAPVINPHTKYGDSKLSPAFNSLDMIEIIEKYQPALWVYGHTHECDDQTIGQTRIISNQLGYPNGLGGYECDGFDEAGLPVEL